jgi:cytochrome bd ubiquinol oxidase subunit I
LTAVMETIYVKTGNEEYKRMAKFWGKIFVINFAVGVVTGITLEFQFGTNWARYSKYVGDIFGSLLAIEATTSFFLESTFIGIWIFGWNKLSPKVHALCIWLVAIAGSFSAYWILSANTWMQNPVGYVIREGRAEVTDFLAVITQPFAVITVAHALLAGYTVGSFFIMGVSALQILKNRNVEFYLKSFRLALIFGLIFSLAEVVVGDLQGKQVAAKQPLKVAALESFWETQKPATFSVIVIPDEANERNSVELIQIPKFMSWLLYDDSNAEVKGLKAWPKADRPPVAVTYYTFRIMVALGFLFPLLTITGYYLRNRLEANRWYLWIMVLALPLPWIATEFGWIVTEVGRQPWIVYGLMRTADAASNIHVSQVGVSLTAFIVVYSLLGIAAFFLIAKTIKDGPGEALPKEPGTGGIQS